MAVKSANVMARVEPDIKVKAEAILERIGLPRSVAIDMYYRQIIYHNGLPFVPVIPSEPKAIEDMNGSEINAKLSDGLKQAKNGEGVSADEFFTSLREEILNARE